MDRFLRPGPGRLHGYLRDLLGAAWWPLLDCPTCLESFTRLHELVEDLEHYDPSVAPEILTAEELFGKLSPLPLPGKVARVREDTRGWRCSA